MKGLLSLLNSGLADNPLTAWRESWRGSATWRPNLARKLARFGDLATKFGEKTYIGFAKFRHPTMHSLEGTPQIERKKRSSTTI